jgi:putative FmdB family regulatory protein
MPIFEYECAACGRRFERLSSRDEDAPACPQCGASEVRRRFSVFAVGRAQPERPAGQTRPCGRDDCACGM